MNKPTPPEPLFVTNPYTGKLINILPLLEYMSQDAVVLDGAKELVYRIQQLHDYVSTHVPSTDGSEVDTFRWADMNYELVELRKVFERMVGANA